MKATSLAVLVVALLVRLSIAGGSERLSVDLANLRSPYLELRQAAVRNLAAEAASAEKPLLALYPRSDFRTKALILRVFSRGAPSRGLPLVYEDLTTRDLGVVHAQRKLVAAVFAQARDAVGKAFFGEGEATLSAPKIDGVADWLVAQDLLQLPAPIPAARRALARLEKSKDASARRAATRIAVLVGGVDGMRKRLADLSSSKKPAVAGRAGALWRLVARHDVERAFLAVYEAGGRYGYYEGMYSSLEGLSRPVAGEKEQMLSILVAMLRGRSLDGGGRGPSSDQGYEFVEPLPADFSLADPRLRAGYAISDVGDEATGKRLEEIYRQIPDPTNQWESSGLDIACACAALGHKEPLREQVSMYERQLGRLLPRSGDVSMLAMAYGRLGEYDKAVDCYRQVLVDHPNNALMHYNLACTLSRKGDVKGAVEELREAVRNGFGLDPMEVVWMNRDGELARVRKTKAYEELEKKLANR